MKTKLKQLACAVVTVIFAAVSLTVPASAAAKVPSPQNTKVTAKTESTVSLQWDKVESAAKYTIYYSTNGKKDYSVYGSTTKTKAIVKDLKPDTKYWFYVRAIDKDGNKSGYAKVVSAIPKATETVGIKVITSPGKVQNGKKATLKIQGEPNTKYQLFVHYPSKKGEAKGIGAVTSDKDGYASWTWTVGTRTTPGTHKITIVADGKTYDLGKILETYKKNG